MKKKKTTVRAVIYGRQLPIMLSSCECTFILIFIGQKNNDKKSYI